MKNIKKLFLFQLKTQIKTIAVWALACFGVMSLYMVFFSTMQEMAQAKFEMLPEEFLQFVGMSELSELGNYVNYFGMIYNLLLIVISVYAVTLGVGIIEKEEKSNTVEYLYSLSYSGGERKILHSGLRRRNSCDYVYCRLSRQAFGGKSSIFKILKSV